EWCKITIPILWQNPFKHCKYKNDDDDYNIKNNSLKKTIYYFLKSPEKRIFNYDYESDIPPMFKYLEYVKHVHATHIYNILKGKDKTITTINLLLRSSVIIKNITLQDGENFNSLKKYMINHKVNLALINPTILLSEKFKFKDVDNLNELSLIRIIILDSDFFFSNLSNLKTLRLFDMKDISFHDIILLKNLKFLVLVNTIHDADHIITIIENLNNLSYLDLVSQYININDIYLKIYISFYDRI
ncbi:7825_t:CDS:1, partial [Cetraspora pellucida]